MKVSSASVYKLALLWAFAEGGLGGLLHGLHLPVTGLVLGAFAVLTISLIAHLSEKPGRDIVQATLLVLAIKFATSPHSPLTAYVAVFFQGVSGALLFSTWGRTRFSVLLFAIVALVESAIQKPLLATLLFGTQVWVAIDALANRLILLLGSSGITNFSAWLVALYVAIHAGWGMVVGLWAFQLPSRIERVKVSDLQRALTSFPQENGRTQKRKRHWTMGVVLMLLVGFAVAYSLPNDSRGLYLFRILLIIISLYILVVPLFNLLLAKWAGKREGSVQDYLRTLPRLSLYVQTAWKVAAAESTHRTKLSRFILYCFWLTLFADTEEWLK